MASFLLHVWIVLLYYVYIWCCCALFCLFAARLFHRVHSKKKRSKGPLIIFGEQETSVLVALSVSIDILHKSCEMWMMIEKLMVSCYEFAKFISWSTLLVSIYSLLWFSILGTDTNSQTKQIKFFREIEEWQSHHWATQAKKPKWTDDQWNLQVQFHAWLVNEYFSSCELSTLVIHETLIISCQHVWLTAHSVSCN